MDKKYLNVYAVTDRKWLNGRKLSQDVEEAILGGATMIQLREKDMSDEEMAKEAKALLEVTRVYGVPLIINDRVNVCVLSGADGVHVGQSDMDAVDARKILGPDKIIGVTAKTVEQAQKARDWGADYLGCGAVFGSTTKLDALSITKQKFNDVVSSVDIPVVAIGGISGENILELEGYQLDGVAVVSAIFAQKDIKKATTLLKEKAVAIIR